MAAKRLLPLIAALLLVALGSGPVSRSGTWPGPGSRGTSPSTGEQASSTPNPGKAPAATPDPAPEFNPWPYSSWPWQGAFAYWDGPSSLGLSSFGSTESLESLRRLKDVGANTVSPVITWYVPYSHASHLHPGPGTPTDEDLVATMDEAHQLGLHVVLRLHVDCEDGEWRARIDPDDKGKWFGDYQAMLVHYAQLGQAHGVEGMVIGTELVGVSGPKYTVLWQSMIASVRHNFQGFLTYSAEWGSTPPDSRTDPYREFDQIGFWRQLDYLGISAYFELADGGHPHPSIEDLRSQWDKWRQLQIEPFQARFGMPLLFTEVGYRSADGAAVHPWDGALSGRENLQLQADLYEALFESWAEVPWFRGAYFWYWPTDAGSLGTGNVDYPPVGKPAEQVLRFWYRVVYDMEVPALKPQPSEGTIPPAERR